VRELLPKRQWVDAIGFTLTDVVDGGN
jgi:hypothetical protein